MAHDNREGILKGFEPPNTDGYEWMVAPLRAWFAPTLHGLEGIDPSTPALWVGNHSIYGLIDVAVFGSELYLAKGIFLRGLADRSHFMIPGWRDTLIRMGAVLGTPDNCSALMREGENVLVFPGGGREVMKRKGERYKLLWKNRTGFARLAIRHGYPIIPFASVGTEDAFDIWVDANDILDSPIGKLLTSVGVTHNFLRDGDSIPPISRGLGLTSLPRPEPLHFGFCERIETTEYAGLENDEQAVYELRDRVRDAVRDEITRLRKIRETDNQTSYLRRLINRFS